MAKLVLGRGKGDRDHDIEIPKAGDGSSRTFYRAAGDLADRLSSPLVVRAGGKEDRCRDSDDQRTHESTDVCSCWHDPAALFHSRVPPRRILH